MELHTSKMLVDFGLIEPWEYAKIGNTSLILLIGSCPLPTCSNSTLT